MVAMLRINHKIISVAVIFNLIVYGVIPASAADMSDAPDVPNIGDFHQKMADNYNKIALQQLPKRPIVALKFLHLASFCCPDDERSKINLDKAVTAIGKDPHNFKDRVALGDKCLDDNDFQGAIVEYRAALLIRNDSEIKSRLASVESKCPCPIPESKNWPQPRMRKAASDTVSLEEWQKMERTGTAPDSAAPDAPTQAGLLTWHTNLLTAEKLAAREHKLVFVYFFLSTFWRCQQSDRETFSDPKVVQLLNDKFICVRLDVTLYSTEPVVEKVKQCAVPSMAIFNANGRALAYFEGYRTPELFVHTINQVFDMLPSLPAKGIINFREDAK